ncbi:MFS transporter [Angustibacter sp. McL0619]|uniref:MFS transporter n=1 Tax=Angustibacter sp. McL0619 TaxID=3415676 RepID=UPI003CEBD80F
MSHESAAVLEPAAPEPDGAEHDHGHRHLGIALALISAAQLMVVLDGTIVNIALPHIQQDLGFSQANLSWVVNAYTLAFGGLLLLGGRAGDLLGRRKMFMVGVGLFGLASLFGGIAQTEGQMLAARVLQGVGAAIASPTALALITTTFPAGPPRNRAFGVYAAMSGAGAAVGLILGGVLTEYSWRWTFFINVPIGLAVLFLAPRFLGESARERGSFDIPGAITATAGLVSLVYGLTHAATTSWSNPTTITTIAAGLTLIAVFLVIESRAAHPLLPFRILANRTRAVSFIVMLIVGAAMFAMFYFLGLFIQQVLGYSSLKAGLAFLPFSFGIVAAAQLASALLSRVDPRWISGVGAVLVSGAMLGLTQLQVDSTYLTGLLPWIILLSFGLGLIFVPLTLTAVSGVAREDSGVGSAVLNTMQQVGGSLGLATLSTVAVAAATNKGQQLGAALAASGGKPTAEQLHGVALAAQTYGAQHAFLVAAGMVLGGAVIILFGLNIKHEVLAADGEVAVAHMG